MRPRFGELSPRRLVKTGLAGLRLAWALGTRTRPGPAPDRAVILLYHRVLPEADLAGTWSSPHIVVSVSDFSRQMEQVARQAHPLGLGELLARHRAGEALPPRSVVVTFDDGWRDNFLYAAPVLRRQGIPATIFLATDLIGTEAVFWQERLRFLLARPALVRLAARERSALGLPEGPVEAEGLIAGCKVRGGLAGPELVEGLEAALGRPEFPRAAHAMLSWDEVRAMAAGGLDFGGHGASHAILTRLAPEAALAECRVSRAAIARELGHAPQALAYPNGDWNPAVAALARQAGYAMALAIGHGRNRSATDLFGLARINVGSASFRGPLGRASPLRFAAALMG